MKRIVMPILTAWFAVFLMLGACVQQKDPVNPVGPDVPVSLDSIPPAVLLSDTGVGLGLLPRENAGISPDAKWVFFRSEIPSTLTLINVEKGTRTEIPVPEEYQPMDWAGIGGVLFIVLEQDNPRDSANPWSLHLIDVSDITGGAKPAIIGSLHKPVPKAFNGLSHTIIPIGLRISRDGRWCTIASLTGDPSASTNHLNIFRFGLAEAATIRSGKDLRANYSHWVEGTRFVLTTEGSAHSLVDLSSLTAAKPQGPVSETPIPNQDSLVGDYIWIPSPDGKYILTPAKPTDGGNQPSLRLLDARTGRSQLVLRKHPALLPQWVGNRYMVHWDLNRLKAIDLSPYMVTDSVVNPVIKNPEPALPAIFYSNSGYQPPRSSGFRISPNGRWGAAIQDSLAESRCLEIHDLATGTMYILPTLPTWKCKEASWVGDGGVLLLLSTTPEAPWQRHLFHVSSITGSTAPEAPEGGFSLPVPAEYQGLSHFGFGNPVFSPEGRWGVFTTETWSEITLAASRHLNLFRIGSMNAITLLTEDPETLGERFYWTGDSVLILHHGEEKRFDRLDLAPILKGQSAGSLSINPIPDPWGEHFLPGENLQVSPDGAWVAGLAKPEDGIRILRIFNLKTRIAHDFASGFMYLHRWVGNTSLLYSEWNEDSSGNRTEVRFKAVNVSTHLR